MDHDRLFKHVCFAAAFASADSRLAEEALRAQQRETRIVWLARFVGARERGRTSEQCLAEARRAFELAERVGVEAGRASPAPTHDVVERHIETIEWLAARGEPLPKDEVAMRAAAQQKAARDLFASLGVAFPWA